jgi:hypothetical protein
MNDERFFDLAVKAIAHQATDAERTDLDALLADKPDLRAEFMRLEKDALVAKDVLPLVAACTSSTGQFPAYARERLQTTVRQMLGRPESAAEEPDRSLAWGWRWVLGLAAATAVVVIMALSIFHAPNAPVIQLAMLDTVGEGGTFVADRVGNLYPISMVASTPTPARTPSSWNNVAPQPAPPPAPTPSFFARPAPMSLPTATPKPALPSFARPAPMSLSGTRGADMNELATLQGTWKESPVQHFSSASELEAWEKNWPKGGGRSAAKIIYDPAAGEVRVSGRSQGKAFQKTFPLEKDLAATLQQVNAFVREQTKRK